MRSHDLNFSKVKAVVNRADLLTMFSSQTARTPSGPLDADLLKDLRSLGKPPMFGATDSEYEDFRFCSNC